MRTEHEQFKKIDAAFKAGDLAALRAAADDPAMVPNGSMPLSIGLCLEYAIYHSPISFIRTLLDIGADPNPRSCWVSSADRSIVLQPPPAGICWTTGCAGSYEAPARL